ncbi:complement C1q-like protein 2 [Leuresthes tenuis]|uniref:complement C1q-like protein 2 n=1 Tax=Leuresthes tenuis TaxID=355514 RepID=UPI003B50F870
MLCFSSHAAKFESQGAEIETLKKQLEGQVAFSAALTDSHRYFGPFNTFTTLVFRHVVTNIGNAYNDHTGIFTAPVKGAYHFEWYVSGQGGPTSGAALVRNGERIFLAYEHQRYQFASSSNGATLLLESGDQVFVQQWHHSRIYDNQNHHTTFSGRLLFIM